MLDNYYREGESVTITRRTLMDRALKGSVLCLTYQLGGASVLLTPGEARAEDVPLQSLNRAQAKTIELLAETMVPGASDAGVVHFIDHQLGEDPNEALLLAKYFQAPLPYLDFYAGGIMSADKLADEIFGKPIASLNKAQTERLVKEMSAPGKTVGEYPIALFYMCVRSDAVDVVYGNPEGFKKLNIPYMEHILPPEGWNV